VKICSLTKNNNTNHCHNRNNRHYRHHHRNYHSHYHHFHHRHSRHCHIVVIIVIIIIIIIIIMFVLMDIGAANSPWHFLLRQGSSEPHIKRETSLCHRYSLVETYLLLWHMYRVSVTSKEAWLFLQLCNTYILVKLCKCHHSQQRPLISILWCKKLHTWMNIEFLLQQIKPRCARCSNFDCPKMHDLVIQHNR
jgi:hypothetical protein